MSSNLYAASSQWASRPADERFWGIDDLLSSQEQMRNLSRESLTPLRAIRIDTTADGQDIALFGPSGNPAKLTNWSFTQLARKCNAPPSYLSTLPAPLAVSCLQQGWGEMLSSSQAEEENTSLLLTKNDGALSVRSMSSEMYGRIWNVDIATLVRDFVLPLGWMVPPARPCPYVQDDRARPATFSDIVPNQDDFGLSVKVGDMIAPAGVYAGDRDLFIFLVNPERVIDDGGKGLMRGVFITNSEVGAGSFKIRSFLLENVCGNHICWGTSEIKDVKIVHKKGAIVGFSDRMYGRLSEYANESEAPALETIKKAKALTFGKDAAETCDAVYNLRSLSLTRKDIEGGLRYAVRWEHTANASPYSAWGLHHGLTRYSQEASNADRRNALDNASSKLLALAASTR